MQKDSGAHAPESFSFAIASASALPGLLLRGAMQMTVGTVEHGIGRGGPLGLPGEVRPVGVDAARLQLALGGLLLAHRLQLEHRLLRNHDDLRERLALAEDVRASLVRCLEHAEE